MFNILIFAGIILGVIGIVAIPLLIVNFFGSRDWRFQRIDKKVLEEKNRAEWKNALRLIGFLLILLAFGTSLFSFGENFGGLSFWPRALIAFAGVILIGISTKINAKMEN